MTVAEPPPDRCPQCGLTVDDARASRHGEVERAGCPGCALQLIRRPGRAWEGIRG